MKTPQNTKTLPLFTAGLGILALALRIALLALGNDEKGLLIPGHPLDILVWIVTAIAVLPVLLCIRKPKGPYCFVPSAAAAFGSFALAGGIAVAVIFGWNPWSRLELVRDLCGLLAIPALMAEALRRYEGKQTFFLLHAPVCVYLTLYTVSHYQIWCSRPQLQDWFFSMIGCLLLMLFAYYQTAFDVEMGKPRMQQAAGLASVFFCTAAMAAGEEVPLYLGGAVWALTSLCSLTPAAHHTENSITEPVQEDAQ